MERRDRIVLQKILKPFRQLPFDLCANSLEGNCRIP